MTDPSPTSSSGDPTPRGDASDAEEFAQLAESASPGLLRELIDFARENKKWWLLPIIFVLLFVAAFIFVSGAAGPFIYPLF
jgi:hypothetical protein